MYSKGDASHLDYLFVRKDTQGLRCSSFPAWYSDHDMVKVTFSLGGRRGVQGTGIFNCELLKNRGFAPAFVHFYDSVRASQPLYSSIVDWWEAAKVRIGMFCRGFTRAVKQREKAEIERWMSSLTFMGKLMREWPLTGGHTSL